MEQLVQEMFEYDWLMLIGCYGALEQLVQEMFEYDWLMLIGCYGAISTRDV